MGILRRRSLLDPVWVAAAMAEGVSYLLRDDYSTALAAGSIDDSLAAPGPGVRDVATDTESKMSISGGSLVFAGGKAAPAWGDPGLWYQSRARTAGEVMAIRATTGSSLAGININFGYDSSQSSLIARHAIWFNEASLAVYNGAGFQVGAIQTNTQYDCIIVTRANGAYYFVRSPSDTYPLMVFASGYLNTTPMYPGISNNNSADSFDFFRIAQDTWLPTPLAYDTFTRADGALGSTETAGPDGQSCAARAWTAQSGTWAVASNAASATAAGIATVNAGTADVVFVATLTTPGSGTTAGGLVLRYTDADNYWYLRVIPGTAGTDLQLIERNTGVETVRGSADVDWATSTGYNITVVCRSNNHWLVTTDTGLSHTKRVLYTTENAFNSTATAFGLRDEGNANFTFDNVQIFAVGTGGEYSRLATFFR